MTSIAEKGAYKSITFIIDDGNKDISYADRIVTNIATPKGKFGIVLLVKEELAQVYFKTTRERERERETERDRETERQRETETERQRQRQTDRQTDRQTGRQAGRQTVQRTIKAEFRPEEQSQKAESCRENLWNEIQLKGI